jgi:16S rRNA (cytosine967-C5)-methyltransferase
VTAAPAKGDAAGSPGVSPARAAAFTALRRLRTSGSRLDESAAALPELSSLSVADRGLANELVNGTVKRRSSIDAVLGSYTKAPLKTTHPDVRDALRLAAFQLLFLDRVPAYAVVDDSVTLATRTSRRAGGFVNAVLRRVATDGRVRLTELGEGDGTRAWAVALSYPPWLVKLLREELGDVPARRMLEAANSAPERCLRANRLRGGLPAAVEALAAEGLTTRGVEGLPDGLLYEGPPLERSRAFREGLVTPQSRGSQIAGMVAAGGVAGPGAAVLDLCAAPGAKTSQLAALLSGVTITAVEVDEARADDLRRNLARLGADEVDVLDADALDPHPAWEGAFDAVLLDAPCTGLGTLASRADLRWRRHVSDVERLAALQAQLLERAAAAVRPGGALTYAVCTMTRAETIGVVEPLLAAGGWEADDLGAVWPGLAHPSAGGFLLILPPGAGSSGFFVARLRRRGGAKDPRPVAPSAG